LLWVAAARATAQGQQVEVRRSTNLATGNLSQWQTATALGRKHSSFESLVVLPRANEEMFVLINGDALMGYGFNGTTWSEAMGGGSSAWYPLGHASTVTSTATAVLVKNGEVYIGGGFGVLKWDGSVWRALGSGISGVNVLAFDSYGNLYAGGYSLTGDIGQTVARWDGAKWRLLDSGTNGPVAALAINSAGHLFVGGKFTMVGGAAANYIAKWDGTAWSSLGSGTNGYVNALALDSVGALYAGGDFTSAGGMTANRIAKWNGDSWSPLGLGANADVRAIVLDDLGNIYIGGSFTVAGGIVANSVAKWNGTSWSALGNGMDGAVNALVWTTGLFAGGEFMTAGSTTVNRIARWTGASWSACGEGANNTVRSLANSGTSQVFAAGDFTQAGAAGVSYVAKWEASTWGPLGLNGTIGTIYAVTADAVGNIYAGGNFTRIGGAAVNYLAKWDGATWTSVDSGVNNTVRALLLNATGSLIIGGDFTTAGGSPANRIAEWTGTSWRTFGSGAAGAVYALAIDTSGSLYAGGDFSSVGGVNANNIAKWTGAAWSALGSGVNGSVRAIAAAKSGGVFAGGRFQTAGGILTPYTAQWDGATWRDMKFLSLGAPVAALVVDSSNNLFAGLDMGDGRIFKWDGATWARIGGQSSLATWALTMDTSGRLYAGGMLEPGANGGGRVAMWDGTAWTALGDYRSPSLGEVHALTVSDGKPVAGSTGVHFWGNAIGDATSVIVAAANTTNADIWEANPTLDDSVTLRRYSISSWGAATDARANRANPYDIGLLFDGTNNRGMVIWSEDDVILKKDFNAAAVATDPDVLARGMLGLFTVGELGDGVNFPVVQFGSDRTLNRGVVQSDAP
jgi:hypothetical protein